MNTIGIVFLELIVFIFVILDLEKRKKRKVKVLEQEIEKQTSYAQLYCHWLEAKNNGESSEKYFKELGYKRIAVYGMGEMASRLLEELKESSITILYGIDQNACCTISTISEVYSPDDELMDVDVIVVTPFMSFFAIKQKLEQKVTCPIISIEEVIWSI